MIVRARARSTGRPGISVAARRDFARRADLPVRAAWAVTVQVLAACLSVGCAGPERQPALPEKSSGEQGATAAERAMPRRTVEAVAPAEPRLDAIAGATLVVPIVPADASIEGQSSASWRPTSRAMVGKAVLASGKELKTELYEFVNEQGVAAAVDVAGWMPASSRWRGYVFDDEAPERPDRAAGEDGFWAVVIEIPAGARGEAVRLGGKPLNIRWLDASAAPAAPAIREEAGARELSTLLRSVRSDPLRRWRLSLLASRIGTQAAWGPGGEELDDDAGLRAWAEQVEARWRAALGLLRRAGADTHDAVLARLTAVVEMPWGVALPMWPLEDAGLSALRAGLLDPAATDEQRLDLAQLWLRENPSMIALVLDDGSLGAKGEGARSATADAEEKPTVRATILASNLSEQGMGVWAGLEGSGASATTRLNPMSAAVLGVDVPTGASQGVARVNVRGVEGSAALGVRAFAARASPPGLTLGPLLAMWDMAGVRRGAAAAMEPSWASSCLLQRDGRGAWTLYIECKSPPGSAEMGRDTVRIHVGPADKPGKPIVVTRPKDAPEEQDRWTATITIPDAAIGADGLLSIGVERVDARGVRSTWPRPVLPGQTMMPRALLDLSAWSDLREPESPVEDGRGSATGR